MNVDGELGGNDQIFNMLCGRDLMKTMRDKEKFVVAVKLLEDNTGKKMGKTDGNMVALSDTAEKMYGNVMSWNDSLIISGFELCTNISTNEIEKIKTEINSNKVNFRDLKMKLSFEITSIYHGDKNAKKAENIFINTFQKKEIPTDIESIVIEKGTQLVDAFLSNKIVSSKSDFRRLVESSSITNLDTDEKTSSHIEIAKSGVYRIGKKRFCKIIVK
jgi:tyrosyl-tRNA synthetase